MRSQGIVHSDGDRRGGGGVTGGVVSDGRGTVAHADRSKAGTWGILSCSKGQAHHGESKIDAVGPETERLSHAWVLSEASAITDIVAPTVTPVAGVLMATAGG